jgi:hypothetical protein
MIIKMAEVKAKGSYLGLKDIVLIYQPDNSASSTNNNINNKPNHLVHLTHISMTRIIINN